MIDMSIHNNKDPIELSRMVFCLYPFAGLWFLILFVSFFTYGKHKRTVNFANGALLFLLILGLINAFLPIYGMVVYNRVMY